MLVTHDLELARRCPDSPVGGSVAALGERPADSPQFSNSPCTQAGYHALCTRIWMIRTKRWSTGRPISRRDSSGDPEDLGWQPAVRFLTVAEAADHLSPEAAPIPCRPPPLRHTPVVPGHGTIFVLGHRGAVRGGTTARHLAGGLNPSHADIHRFRREHEAALTRALENSFEIPRRNGRRGLRRRGLAAL